MNLIARYRRLGFWTKLGVWGSISSIVAFPPLWLSFSSKGVEGGSAASTLGNNSPIIQAGDNATISFGQNDPNVATKDDIRALRSEIAALKELLRLKADENNDALLSKYRYGYILVRNVVKGTQKVLVRESRLQSTFRVEADWDNASIAIDQQAQRATVSIPNLHFVTDNLNMRVGTASDSFPFMEGHPVQTGLMRLGNGPNMFYEILDTKNEIFVIGFK